uniref:5'-nucleotidase n=1 Tax=Syphacia muris TaxID=451379 RepID=A0A0N5B0V2_9BILA
MEFLKTYCKIRCRDVDLFHQKIRKFFMDGSEHLIVIADFDYTLSRSKSSNGEKCPITYEVFEEAAKRTSPLVAKQFAELSKKYYPIELDPNIPVIDKIPHMVQCDFKSDADIFLKILKENNIPLIIFSAGIGDVIDCCIKSKIGSVDSNIHIISNMFTYNKAGITNGFSTPLIHTYCKDGKMIENCPSLKRKLSGRHNVLLMGDSLGDVTMADGYSPTGGKLNVLKLGFLNDVCEKYLSNYCGVYDAVLVDDQTMLVPNEIINFICTKDD